jgi:Rrf2 family iron-sulfur cluster assembly transcriptional regulator
MAMLALAVSPSGHATCASLAQRLRVPKRNLDRLLARLRSAGLLKAFRGPGGGFIVARKPDAITVEDVMIACGDLPEEPGRNGRIESDAAYVDVACRPWLAAFAAYRNELRAVTLDVLEKLLPSVESDGLMYYI